MAAKPTTMTYKIAIQLHLVAEGCTIWSSYSRWPVWKLLDTPSSKTKINMNTVLIQLEDNTVWSKDTFNFNFNSCSQFSLNSWHIRGTFCPPPPYLECHHHSFWKQRKGTRFHLPIRFIQHQNARYYYIEPSLWLPFFYIFMMVICKNINILYKVIYIYIYNNEIYLYTYKKHKFMALSACFLSSVFFYFHMCFKN
jgi:hypothetical protein